MYLLAADPRELFRGDGIEESIRALPRNIVKMQESRLENRVFGEPNTLGPQGSDFQTVGLLLDNSAGSERAGPGIQQVGRRMSPLCYPGLWARNGQASYPS